MAERSIKYNDVFAEQIKMVHGDIKSFPKEIGNDKFDVVTCNPPYFPTPSQERNQSK